MKSYTTLTNTAQNPARFELVEKKSRFIGQAIHVESDQEARAFLEQVRAENREARHNVFAYVLRGEAQGSCERQSDDGEPQKTAGLPTLEVIRHSEITDVLVVVTRYFGGTLLGTGGLVRAYTKAAQGALAAADTVLMSTCVDVQVVMPYSLYDTALYTLEQVDARVISTGFTDVVTLFFRMVDGTQEAVVASFRDLLAGKGELVEGAPHFCAF